MTIFDFSSLGFKPGEVAVVTGAGNGIGRSVALMLAKSGVAIAAWDIEQQAVDAVVAEIDEANGVAYPVLADLSEQAGVDSAWEQTAASGRSVQYLVNNAGPPSSADLPVSEGVRISIGSYASVTEGFVERHSASAASMTFTASIAGNFMAGGTMDWYPAAKAGIAGYMRNAAVKYRGRPRANCVAPGATVTRRTATMFASADAQRRLERHPMGRAADADEVAAVICFLLSPAASYVNGALVPIDGAVTWTLG
jgi:NAD(P)-dependent dehydrogenase (short-subunit alcohol dehydrogenase family)